jgi:hypothetical protein
MPGLSAGADEVIEYKSYFAAVHESANGTKRTFRKVRYLVAIGGKADLCAFMSTRP